MSTYETTDKNGDRVSVSGRDKNILLSIYTWLDSIASNEEWEEFWLKNYEVQTPGEFSSNRKILWIREDNKWFYTDMHEVHVYPTTEAIEKLMAEAIEQVKAEQTKKSKFLETLTPQKAKELLELFSCFEWL